VPGTVESVAQSLAGSREPETVFTVRKLKYGGYEVLREGDADVPRRHVCDFRSEFEAKNWIKENAILATGRADWDSQR
jgi:hypothetical protein